MSAFFGVSRGNECSNALKGIRTAKKGTSKKYGVM
jgi:hypothetical protein